MIRITKPTQPPTVLGTKGKSKCADCCGAYDNGQREFKFDERIYNAKTVKDALVKAQHEKCCFCESVVGDDGDVEHFRPKSTCCQGRGQPTLSPGYYWLAYEWDNLLLCCSACNTRHKRNHFPLADPGTRARSHHDDLGREEPLIIHPAESDPEQYISFYEELAFAINGNACGKKTIEILGLNRANLKVNRREHLEHLQLLRSIIKRAEEYPDDPELQELADAARSKLQHALQEDAKFAAMSRAAAKEDFYFK